jgi:hypothetical protein
VVVLLVVMVVVGSDELATWPHALSSCDAITLCISKCIPCLRQFCSLMVRACVWHVRPRVQSLLVLSVLLSLSKQLRQSLIV